MSGSKVMQQWRTFFESSGEDIMTIIERAIIVAHTDHPEELRMRRDGFTERMYAPYPAHTKRSDEVLSKGSDKTNAMSGVSKTNEVEEGEDDEDEGDEDEEEEPQPHRERERERERETEQVGDSSSDEERDEETGNEIVQIEVSEDDDEAAVDELVHDDAFDDDEVEALNDEIEREKLLLNDIYSIKNSIKDVHQTEAEVMDLLYRIEGLNISVEALKATNIGKSVNIYRHHPSRAVQSKTREIVKSWKNLVDEWMRSVPAVPASAHEESVAVGDDEVGLPSPPLDEGGLLAARTVEMNEFFNFTDDDLSAASGPSPPTSDGLSDFGTLSHRKTKIIRTDYHHSGRHSSSPDQDQGARELKAVGRVYKVDKHRPAKAESKIDQNPRHTSASSGPMRGSVLKNAINRPVISSANARRLANARNLDVNNGAGVGRSDGLARPNMASRPKVETTQPGLSTGAKGYASVVSESERLEASKRKLQTNYMMHDLAKKQRTVQPLELTDLPKGGPKAQRPGQNRGRVNGRK